MRKIKRKNAQVNKSQRRAQRSWHHGR